MLINQEQQLNKTPDFDLADERSALGSCCFQMKVNSRQIATRCRVEGVLNALYGVLRESVNQSEPNCTAGIQWQATKNSRVWVVHWNE